MKCEYTIHHSLIMKRNVINNFAGLFFGIFFLLVVTDQLQAQMFSVGNPGSRFNVPQTEFYLGLEPMDVTYEGDNIQRAEAGAFEFTGSVLRLGYESPALDIFMGTGGSITGIEEASYFDAGGNIDFGLGLYRSRSFSLEIPLRIASRYTNITSNEGFQFTRFNRFRFGSLTAGAGIHVRARPLDDLRFRAGAVPGYGFAFASDGFFGGSLGSVVAHSRLYFDRLIEDVGLSVGYKYDLRNYDIDEDIYDYKVNGHSLELGITF